MKNLTAVVIAILAMASFKVSVAFAAQDLSSGFTAGNGTVRPGTNMVFGSIPSGPQGLTGSSLSTEFAGTGTRWPESQVTGVLWPWQGNTLLWVTNVTFLAEFRLVGTNLNLNAALAASSIALEQYEGTAHLWVANMNPWIEQALGVSVSPWAPDTRFHRVSIHTGMLVSRNRVLAPKLISSVLEMSVLTTLQPDPLLQQVVGGIVYVPVQYPSSGLALQVQGLSVQAIRLRVEHVWYDPTLVRIYIPLGTERVLRAPEYKGHYGLYLYFPWFRSWEEQSGPSPTFLRIQSHRDPQVQ